MNYNMQMKYMYDDYEQYNKNIDAAMNELFLLDKIRQNEPDKSVVSQGKIIEVVEIVKVKVEVEEKPADEETNYYICLDILNEIISKISEDEDLPVYPDKDPFENDNYSPEWPIDYITHEDKLFHLH